MAKAIKIAYFPSTTLRNVVLGSNGIALDNYCTKAIPTEDLSGTYLLDATFVIDNKIIDYLQEENILKVKMDYGDEVFRISKVTKSTRYIDIVARQITIADTIAMYLDDVRPTNTNGLGALNTILSNADVGKGRVKEIFVNSDISDISTAYYQNMSVYQAIHDCEQSFLNRWGGEVQRRAYTLTINKSIGANRGVCIREGKNLTGFSADTNLNDLCTRAIGESYNGIKGNYVYSSRADKYAKVYTKTFEYNNIRLKGDDTEEDSENTYFDTKEEVIAELDKLVALEFSNNNVDELKATYNINFVQLEKTEEYKNYVQAERVFLGDTVRVYIPKLDTDIQVRVIEKKYDVLAQKTVEITLSNMAEKSVISMSSIISDLKRQYKNTGNNSIADYIDSIIKAGMKDSYVIVRNGELLAMDTQDINTATIVTRLNKNGLGFSSTGYYGEYTYGFTLDGKINASLISTGILSTILIQNADGSFRIDLSGTGGASFYNNGKIAMKMERNALNFYDWKDSGYIGSLGSTRNIEKDKPFIELWHELTTAMSFGYRNSEGTISPYLRLDENGVIDDEIKAAIQAYKDIGLVNYVDLLLYGNDKKIPLGVLALDKNNNMHVCCGRENDNRTLNFGSIDVNDYKKFNNWITLTKDRIDCYKKLYITVEGKTGTFSLSGILNTINNTLDSFNERLNNLESK